MNRTSALVALVALALGLSARGQSPEPARPRLVLNAPNHPLVWDAHVKQVNPTGMVALMDFTFSVTNVSPTETVTIHETETSCDCTVAGMPAKPWILPPGGHSRLPVRWNTLGKFGSVTNWIGIHTSHGPQLLMVRSDIPLTPAAFNVSGRARDQEVARADRQAVLTRTDCAACHALPATGRTGKDLFTKVCAICHVSEHRASMVPDLATLPRATDAEYWRDWIRRGKTNTFMPAFARSAGGILDETQIGSLVTYLLQAYPSRAILAPSASRPPGP